MRVHVTALAPANPPPSLLPSLPQEEMVPRGIMWTIVAVGATGYALVLTLTAVQVGGGKREGGQGRVWKGRSACMQALRSTDSCCCRLRRATLPASLTQAT